ncbi:MAG: DUF86 domain-containing protein [Promethearchaeia archaeon]
MEDNNKVSFTNERIERYIEKLEHFKSYMKNLENWIKDIGKKDFLAINLKDQFAIYHAFQLSVEIITDLIAMTVKDLKIKPRDDYANIRYLKETKFLSEELTESLKKMNGLRNVIVHDYNGIDELLAFKGIKTNIRTMKDFYEVMREWLRKNS